jgi:hypothetical protein
VIDDFQELAAKATGGDGGGEDVRVGENLHETSRKTSSSVR